MALSDQQKVNVRRYAGYPMLAGTPTDASRDFAYGWVSPGVWETLYTRLNNITANEQTVLETVYLAQLADLELAIPEALCNLDTAQAAVWTRNNRELAEKRDLFDDWRRRMCFFIGIPPGPSLGDGETTISRC